MSMNQGEWEARYVQHFFQQVIASCAGDGIQARAWAESDLNAAGYEELVEGFEDDPEGSADESLSYYDADEESSL